MESPFGRGALTVGGGAVRRYKNDVFRPQILVGGARGRDQHAVIPTGADVSRGSLIDALAIHAQAGINDGLAEKFFPGFHS